MESTDPATIKANLIETLDAERRKRGWTEAELAAKSGLTESGVRSIRVGTGGMNSTSLIALATALGYRLVLLRARKSGTGGTT